MKKARFLALMAVAALLLVFPAVVLGQPVPPHLSKLVVSVDGSPAADGTTVTVWMEGAQVASATTSGGIAIMPFATEADCLAALKTLPPAIAWDGKCNRIEVAIPSSPLAPEMAPLPPRKPTP